MTLKLRVGLVGLIAALLSIGTAANRDAVVYGRGNDSCQIWLKDTAGKPIFNAWVHGYVTAASQARTLRTTLPAPLTDFVTRYCTAHPNKTIFDAAEQLVQSLAQK